MSRRGASELAILKEAEDQAAEIVAKAREGVSLRPLVLSMDDSVGHFIRLCSATRHVAVTASLCYELPAYHLQSARL